MLLLNKKRHRIGRYFPPPKIEVRSSTIFVTDDAFRMVDEEVDDLRVVSEASLLCTRASKKFSLKIKIKNRMMAACKEYNK